MQLFKTTIVIWTEYDTDTVDLYDLAAQAVDGNAYISKFICKKTDTDNDKNWDGTEFFNKNLGILK